MNSDTIDVITGEMTELYLAVFQYEELFHKGTARVDLMNDVDGRVFGELQMILRDSIILLITRLFDRQEVCGKETSTFERAITELDLQGKDVGGLKQELKRLKDQYEPLIQQRHKRIAHNDKAVIEGNASIGRPSITDIKAARDDVKDFASKLHERGKGEPIYLEEPTFLIPLGLGYERFFKVLKAGLDAVNVESK